MGACMGVCRVGFLWSVYLCIVYTNTLCVSGASGADSVRQCVRVRREGNNNKTNIKLTMVWLTASSVKGYLQDFFYLYSIFLSFCV